MPTALQPPVVVVPGITATSLRDEYPVDPERVWTPLSREFERVCLHPENQRFERTEPARVRTDDVFNVVYAELIEELRHNLAPARDLPCPVFGFPYDWRKPLRESQDQLLAFVDEVIDRTLLMRHYANDAWADDPRVDLVGHSMGGLIIAGMLAASPHAHVRKVATLGTPYRGSFEAALKIQTGMADLGSGDSGSREREAARLMPGLYHLLPDMAPGVIENGDPNLPLSLFDSDSWQPSVVQTIAQYFKLYGTRAQASPQKNLADAAALFGRLLDEARTHRRSVVGLSLAAASKVQDDWLAIAGVDVATRVELSVDSRGGDRRFDLTSGRDNKYMDSDPFKAARTGDGTVPFLGAIPPFLDRERVVCVSPRDFSYWEIGDRVMASEGLVGFHGQLPNMDLAHRLILSHFKGTPQGDVWGRLPPGVDAAAWRPPIAGLVHKD